MAEASRPRRSRTITSSWPTSCSPATRHFGKDVRLLTVRNGGRRGWSRSTPVTADPPRPGRPGAAGLEPPLRPLRRAAGRRRGARRRRPRASFKAAKTLVFPDLPLASPVATALTAGGGRGRADRAAIVDAHERAALLPDEYPPDDLRAVAADAPAQGVRPPDAASRRSRTGRLRIGRRSRTR